jgi:hypothetical protein
MDADGDGVPSEVEILWPRADGEVGYHPALAGPLGVDRCGLRGTESLTGELETPPVEQTLVAEPRVLHFGDVGPGEMAHQEFTVRNRGTAPVTIYDADIGPGGVDATKFGDSTDALSGLA